RLPSYLFCGAQMRHSGFRLFLECLRVVPGIGRVGKIEVALRPVYNLDDYIPTEVRRLGPGVTLPNVFCVTRIHPRANGVLKQKGLSCLRIAPTLRSVPMNHRQQTVMCRHSEAWHSRFGARSERIFENPVWELFI